MSTKSPSRPYSLEGDETLLFEDRKLYYWWRLAFGGALFALYCGLYYLTVSWQDAWDIFILGLVFLISLILVSRGRLSSVPNLVITDRRILVRMKNAGSKLRAIERTSVASGEMRCQGGLLQTNVTLTTGETILLWGGPAPERLLRSLATHLADDGRPEDPKRSLITNYTAMFMLLVCGLLGIIVIARFYLVDLVWDDLSVSVTAAAVIAFFPALMVAFAAGLYVGSVLLFVVLRPFFSAKETLPFVEILASGGKHRLWRSHDRAMIALLSRWHHALYGAIRS